MKLVFDSSVLIDHLRGGDYYDSLLHDLKDEPSLLIPTIVLTELYSGQSTKQKDVFQKLQKLLSQLEQISLTENIATRAGKLIRDFGTSRGLPDYIIAATALEIGGEVVTLNTKHFQKIPGVAVFEY